MPAAPPQLVCEHLQPLAKAHNFSVWHAGLAAGGAVLAQLQQQQRERADLRVALLSIDLVNDSADTSALCALKTGLGVLIRACTYEPAFPGWKVIDATMATDAVLAQVARDIAAAVAALRGGQSTTADLKKKVDHLKADVAAILQRSPQVAARLAAELDAPEGASPSALAAFLLDRPTANDLAAALNQIDADLEGACDSDAQATYNGAERARDFQAIRELLFLLLPFVIDWRDLLEAYLQTSAPGGVAPAVELRYASATVAELVVAGIDQRAARFQTSSGMPLGAAAIHIPAAARAPFFDVDGQLLVTAIVKHIAARKGIEASSDDALCQEVEGHLRYVAHKAPRRDRLPYYLLFEEAALGPSAWTLARSRVGAVLPCLRLVRLDDRAASRADERVLAESIKALLDRDPPRNPPRNPQRP